MCEEKRKKFTKYNSEIGDTIAAISTPPGEGGIGIIRISGFKSLAIMEEIFTPANPSGNDKGDPECGDERGMEGDKPIRREGFKPRHAYFGTVHDENGDEIDEAICLFMKAPHTYTCEDMCEIQAHGSMVSLRMILGAVIRRGARLAEPGEFTKLAFMNGRIDLSQAEAVMDIISAKAYMPHDIAVKQLGGALGNEIEDIRSEIRDILAQVTVNIDFPDEDIEEAEYSELEASVQTEMNRISRLRTSADTGRIARDGIRAAIVGKPNVGKSSFLNAVLGAERAIVTDLPGTTRDTIEEAASVQGVPIILTDTAGMRDTGDKIERIGIDRARDAMYSADIVIFVMDGSTKLTKEDFGIMNEMNNMEGKVSGLIAVINKEDLGTAFSEEEISERLPNAVIMRTSLKEYGGERKVVEQILKTVLSGEIKSEMGNIIMNERHADALMRAEAEISDGLKAIRSGQALELAEIPIHASYDALGEIIGMTAGDEILDTVFSKFCLGK